MTGLSHRLERLASQIRAEIAAIISEELRDPRIAFTTITRVELTSDLRHAHILVSVLGDDNAQRETLAGLASAAGYIRTTISHRLRLRHVPEIIFVLDHGPEEAMKLEQKLQELDRREPDE